MTAFQVVDVWTPSWCGPLDMGYLRVMSGAILAGRFTPPNVQVTTAAQVANLIVEAGESHGVRLDVAAATAERFRRAAEKGHGQSDLVASYHASFDNGPDRADG
ncbi:hypothetical protein [Actinoplanes sp. NPDC089786]|uniref:imine reductase family protein n=1 Tax=Actinoplanes sp. NPDC089786 TaxID=3155185 RepID=UPI00343FD230